MYVVWVRLRLACLLVGTPAGFPALLGYLLAGRQPAVDRTERPVPGDGEHVDSAD